MTTCTSVSFSSLLANYWRESAQVNEYVFKSTRSLCTKETAVLSASSTYYIDAGSIHPWTSKARTAYLFHHVLPDCANFITVALIIIVIEFKHNRPGIGERAASEGCRTIAFLDLQGLALPQEFNNVIRFLLLSMSSNSSTVTSWRQAAVAV